MNPLQLSVGDRFVVVEPPPTLATIDGSLRGVFVRGETVIYASHRYNSYDGFYMVFFENAPDGSERVWIGDYGETDTVFFSRWEQYFRRI